VIKAGQEVMAVTTMLPSQTMMLLETGAVASKPLPQLLLLLPQLLLLPRQMKACIITSELSQITLMLAKVSEQSRVQKE